MVLLSSIKSMKTDPATHGESLPLNPIRVETALSRYPVHRLARKGSIDINLREGSADSVRTQWEVDYSKKHGQPGPLAYKIDTLIINRRIEEARRPLNRMLRLGSLSDICRELDLADSGKNRSDIKRSLFQNAFAGITAKTSYRSNEGSDRTLEAAFTRYSVILTGEELPDGRKADAVHIILNDVFLQVINGAMTRPLDYDYLKSLPPAPQRFYELLSYQMYATLKYDRPRARLVYSDLCAHAPQTRHVVWNNVRSQMHKVHRPHRESGYIADVEFNPAVDAEGRPDWVILYRPGPKARAEFQAFNKRGGPVTLEVEPFDPNPVASPPANVLELSLTRHGVSGGVARDLAVRHGEEKIAFQVECLEWLLDKHPEKIAEPAAYLVSAIEKDFSAPKRFVSRAERARRAEARAAKEREAAESSRQKQERDARDREERAAVHAYRLALSPEQLAILEDQAIAQASELTRENLATAIAPSIRRMLLTATVNELIRGILREQPGSA